MKGVKILSIPKFGRKEENNSLDENSVEVKQRKPRKKKDPPPKPWGKLERIIVLIILISVPAFSLLFLIRSKDSKFAKPLSLPAPGIVKNVIPRSPKDTSVLKESLNKELDDLNGTYGIWLESLDGNYSLGINQNKKFEGASFFKLPLMITYYQFLDLGKIKSTTSYTIKHSDAQSGAGALANLPAGTVVTYRDMVEAMGKNSDNTAYAILENILSINEEVNTIKNLGMTNTDFKNSMTTPYDIGLLYSKLVAGNIISNNSKDELLSFLTDTEFEDLIPKGVPDNVKVAHKYGSVNSVINDAGVIMSNPPFILVIMSSDAGLEEANREFPALTKIIYDWAVK